MTQREGAARTGFTSGRDDAKHVRTFAMRPDATYDPALDGVRALAVLAVLLFHAEIPGAPGGFLGVSTFFTLSGFLITRLLLAELARTGTIDLGRFWTRRFRRLMPASLLGLAVVLALAHLTTDPTALGRLRGDVFSALAYASNWRFMQTAESYFGIFEDPSPVQHFWSLSIEEQFYLLYPLIVLALWRRRADVGRGLAVPIGALTIAGAAAGVALTTSGASQARVYYGTDTRAPELLVGALLALWMTQRDRGAPSRLVTEITATLALLGRSPPSCSSARARPGSTAADSPPTP
jgi:peptidoglycan/LPS O-acetylase OafA/YrhL